MKYSELKSKFQNKYVIRIIAGVLSVALLGSGYGVYSVNAAKAEEVESTEVAAEPDTQEELENAIKDMVKSSSKEKVIGKDETVYLIANAKGGVNQTIVSDWLKNPDKTDSLKDVSDLKEIENVKGEETFSQNGNDLTWQADGKDIYYQGKTDNEAPISEQITYYLDGKEIEPEDLAGKSGKVTIRFDYANNEKTTKEVNGKEYEVYVPFTVVTGMVLNDDFTNVEVTNGKIISDGKNNVVVGMAMPGLKESLDVESEDFDEDMDFPDYVEITADVENFSLDMTITLATSELLSSLDLSGNMDLSALDEVLDEMTDASSQLVDGSGELSEGVETLQEGVKSYTTGASTIAENLKKLSDGTSTLNGKVPELVNGVDALKEGSDSAVTGADALNTGAKSAAEGAKALSDAYAGKNGAAAGAKALNQGVSQLTGGLETLLSQVGSNAASYSSQAKALYQTDADAAAALTADLTAYVKAQVTYQNLGRGILDVQTAIQSSLASVGASVSQINSQAPEDLKLSVDASSFALGNYMSFNEQTGMYTLTDGLAANVRALANGAAGAAGAVNNTKAATEQTATGLLAVDPSSAAALFELAGAENALAGSLASSEATLNTYAAQLDTLISQYSAAAATMNAAYTKLTSTDEKNPGTIVKVCTYYGTSGAGTALSAVAQSVKDAGLDEAALKTLADGANDLNAAINGGTLSNGKTVKQGLADGTAALSQGLNGYDKADGSHVTGLCEGAGSLLKGLQEINGGLGTLQASTPELTKGVSELNQGASQLKDGANTLISNNGKLTNGVRELLDGSVELKDGMKEFDEKAIQKLADTYHGDVQSLLDRIDAVVMAGEEYTTFSQVADGVNGNVKFILKTDAVKAEAEK